MGRESVGTVIDSGSYLYGVDSDARGRRGPGGSPGPSGRSGRHGRVVKVVLPGDHRHLYLVLLRSHGRCAGTVGLRDAPRVPWVTYLSVRPLSGKSTGPRLDFLWNPRKVGNPTKAD